LTLSVSFLNQLVSSLSLSINQGGSKWVFVCFCPLGLFLLLLVCFKSRRIWKQEKSYKVGSDHGSYKAWGDNPPTNGPTSRLRVLYRFKPILGYAKPASTFSQTALFLFCFVVSSSCSSLGVIYCVKLFAAETIALGFQHYILALGTAVMIPSFLVPVMGGSDVSCFYVQLFKSF